jgi:hypothetical protein
MLNESSLINNVDILFENKIVLYGAGYHGHRMLRILREMGISIKYFCDSDSKKLGHNIYGVEVISPERLKEIDDMENIIIIITVDFSNSCVINQIKKVIENLRLKTCKIFTIENLENVLLANIHYARINTPESENMGCSSLYSYMLIDSDGISTCCKLNDTMNPPPKILWKNNDWNYEKTILEYIKMRNRLIDSIKNKKICECTFCGEIKNNVNFNKINNISFAFTYPCNMRCIYCGVHKEKTDAFASGFNFSHFISICEKKEIFSENLIIGLASGEITISSRVDDMFDIARKYKLSALTNGVIYNETLAELTVAKKYDGIECGWGGDND